MVDSGAEISLIKSGHIKPTELVNLNDKCNITGINSEIVETFGTISSSIQLSSECKLNTKFQLVPDNIPIPTDGILGRDFLVKYKCVIDYNTWILTGSNDEEQFELIIEDNLQGELVLPPRCEVYRKINVKN